MNKRILKSLTFIIVLIAAFCLCMTVASAETSGVYTYSVREDGTAAIDAIDRSVQGNFSVASELDGRVVTKIGYCAFDKCDKLVSVEFPDTVTELDRAIFNECKSLKSVTTGEGVKQISAYMFFNCSALSEVNIGGSVTEIGELAFYGCSSLKAVFIPDGVSSIHERAFVSAGSSLSIVSSSAYVNNYAVNNGINCFAKDKVRSLYVQPNLSSVSATFTWKPVAGAEKYIISRYNTAQKKYERIATVAGKKYTMSGLNPGTAYDVRVHACTYFAGTEYRSSESKLTVRTLESSAQMAVAEARRAAGDRADVTKEEVDISLQLNTDGVFTRWANVSPVSQFKDRNGNLCFAYSDDKYLHITNLDSNQELVSVLRLNKKYKLLGGVACDSSGYYYVVWGNSGTAGIYGTVTVAVSKYKNNGEHVKTAEFKSESERDTRVPFNVGNCAITIKNGILVCSYGREMYSGHQSNGVIAVNTSSMTVNNDYYSYCSHSFDQRVLIGRDGDVWFADHGDCYPRGFQVTRSVAGERTEYIPFHFYAPASAMEDMLVLNQTNAQLGGIAQTSSGAVLAGASVKGMTQAEYGSQDKNLFIMYADNTLKMPGSVPRSGTCLGKNVTDNSVRWLTNYTSGYSVNNPQLVYTDDDRVVLLWERLRNGVFNAAYYMILSSNGTVLQKATQLPEAVRLNSNEEPVYNGGFVYWVSVQGPQAYVNRLKLGSFMDFTVSGLKASSQTSTSVKLTWDKAQGASGYRIFMYNGKSYAAYKTVGADITSCTVTGLKSSGTHYFKIRAYRSISGKTVWGILSPAVRTYTSPAIVSGFKVQGYSANALKLTWAKAAGASGYQIYKYNGKSYVILCTLSGNVNSYTVKNLTTGTRQYFKIRAYRTVSGVNYRGDLGAVLSTATRPANSGITTATSAAQGQLTLKWSKSAGVSGYAVQYSLNSGFSSGVVTKYETSQGKVYSGLASGKTYYVRVRPYIAVGNTRVYSPAYSAVKSVTIK